MFVNHGDVCSARFCVTNGVTQGGFVSHALCNLCMDNLNSMLNCSILVYTETYFLLITHVTP